jgi:hypothetical protein
VDLSPQYLFHYVVISNGWTMCHALRVVMGHSPSQACASQEQIAAAVPDTPGKDSPAQKPSRRSC